MCFTYFVTRISIYYTNLYLQHTTSWLNNNTFYTLFIVSTKFYFRFDIATWKILVFKEKIAVMRHRLFLLKLTLKLKYEIKLIGNEFSYFPAMLNVTHAIYLLYNNCFDYSFKILSLCYFTKDRPWWCLVLFLITARF